MTKSLINLLMSPIKRRRKHADSILEHYWPTFIASQRREELNPSKHNEQIHKQIRGQSMRMQQNTLFVITKECCFIATVKV